MTGGRGDLEERRTVGDTNLEERGSPRGSLAGVVLPLAATHFFSFGLGLLHP